MELVEIIVEPRAERGSRGSRRLRNEGKLPLVVVARGEPSVEAWTAYKEFVQIAQNARSSQLFSLKSSVPQISGKTAVVKAVQKHSVSGQVLHVDLQTLKENEEIEIPVLLKFDGQAPGVSLEGGVLTIARHDVVVACLPRAIPEEIHVDISGLHMGNSIHAKEISLPSGVRLAGNPDETIVSVVAVRQVVEAAAAGAEGAVAEGAAGAAPAEGAAAAPGASAEKESKK